MNINQCHTMCNKAENTVIALKPSCLEQFNCIEAEVIRREYATGGELLHRGYYCPSRIMDLVTGNVNRGHVISNKSNKRNIAFTYGFDKDNHLITIVRPFSKEFVIRKNDVQIGVCFSREGRVETLSECTYYHGNQIATYTLYLFSPSEHRVVEFSSEEYTYRDDCILVDWYRFSRYHNQSPILEHARYTFSVVDGYVVSYSYKDLSNPMIPIPNSEERIFKVNHKRKI